MNCCELSGILAGAPEERTLASGRRLINFDLFIDNGPCIRVGYFLENGSHVNLNSGAKVQVSGSLKSSRHRLFLAATNVSILAGPSKGTSHADH
jgi:hypothetical protein